MEKKKILVLDDEISYLESMKRMLDSNTYEIDTAATVRDALALIQGKRYDIVLFDYLMPEGGGLAFLNSVKGNTKKTKFILITGHTTDAMVGSLLRMGAHGYLRKPFSEEDILKTLEQHLGT